MAANRSDRGEYVRPNKILGYRHQSIHHRNWRLWRKIDTCEESGNKLQVRSQGTEEHQLQNIARLTLF